MIALKTATFPKITHSNHLTPLITFKINNRNQNKSSNQNKKKNSIQIINSYSLKSIGDGDTSHVDDITIPTQSDIPLEKGVFEVGRESPADIIIPVPTVSSRHAILRVDENVEVTDLNSTNGTFIDEIQLEPLKAKILEIDQELIFGDGHLAKFILKYESEDKSKV